MATTVTDRENRPASRRRADLPVSGRRRSPVARAVVGVLVLLALVSAPWWLGAYAINFTSRILVFALLAASVNLLTGVTGLTVLGQAGYFGVGAYTAAIIAIEVTPVGPVQLVGAALVAGAVAALIGLVVARVRGAVFVMITIAVGQLMFVAAIEWRSVTQGSDGILGIPAVVPFWGLPMLRLDGLVYFYVLAFFLVLFGFFASLVRSPFGLALRSVRDNEIRMRAAGYPVGRYIWTAYVLSGALAGAAGSLYVSAQRFFSPPDMGFDTSALVLLAVLIGGAGSMWGSCIGAAVVLLTRDYLGSFLAGRGNLLLGILFVVVAYALPRGAVGLRETLVSLWSNRRSGSGRLRFGRLRFGRLRFGRRDAASDDGTRREGDGSVT